LKNKKILFYIIFFQYNSFEFTLAIILMTDKKEKELKGGNKEIRHIIYGSSNYPKPKPTRFIGI